MSTTSNETAKRKRDRAFANSEKELLLQLVEKHFSVVESKKTDAVSMKNKAEEWRKIALSFNAASAICPREFTVLKNCWENMKKRAKQVQTSRNQHYLGTGGGPPKKEPEDPIVNKVLELIQTRVTGFVNTFDSDNIRILASGSTATDIQGVDNSQCHNDFEMIEPQQEIVVLTESEPTVSVSTDTIDWSEYTPSMLKKPKNAFLDFKSPQELNVAEDCEKLINVPTPKRTHKAQVASTSRRRPVYHQAETLVGEKLDTLKKSKYHAEEEHKLKMSILRTQLEREEELLREAKLKTRQEEIKLQILELELKKHNDQNIQN